MGCKGLCLDRVEIRSLGLETSRESLVGSALFCERLDVVAERRYVNKWRGVRVRWLTNPVLFETLLRAEKAVLYVCLEAGGALQCASFFLAIRTEALACSGRCCFGIGHGGQL